MGVVIVSMNTPVLVATDIVKSFPSAEKHKPPVPVLRGISLKVDPGEMVAIVGPSGSGKSTLLYCLSSLESCSSGSVKILTNELGTLGRGALAKLRRDHIGFVFQSYNLIPSLTARENVALPARLAKRPTSRAHIDQVLASVGLTGRMNHLPGALSGGEQQRVAIARVLAMNSDVVFADEPTGSLDTVTGASVLNLLRRSARGNRAVVLVTHDLEAATLADRVLVMRDGIIHAELCGPSVDEVLNTMTTAASPAFEGN